MISKNQIKLVNSLGIKKFRDDLGLFVAEGTKIIEDLLLSHELFLLCVTHDWLIEHEQLVKNREVIVVTENQMAKISNQKTPQGVLAVFYKKKIVFTEVMMKGKLTLVLDGIQDPGNLGTIIRIADWFGVENIICSETCVDAYAPKTVQATMGALSRIFVHYTDLTRFLDSVKIKMPIYGTFLDGENIYDKTLSDEGLIVMGSEGKGISPLLEPYINTRLFIPNYPEGLPTSESLNVGVATALVCAEFRRRTRVG